MDSKYTSMGLGKVGPVKFSMKRKNPFENANVKNKVFIKNDTNGVKSNSSITNNLPHIEMETKMPNTSENIQETRRKLPIFNLQKGLLEEIKKHDTMIIVGETGSGKTTQIPQFLYNAHFNGNQMIGVTQPRRVAAITVALRVAKEMNNEVGKLVGYTVRFEDVTSPKTKIKYMTDGMLLREAMADKLLKKYSILILDEAHERTVSTDILFGIVKLAQQERNFHKNNPLKVIIMSATIDVDRFCKFFNKCPAIYLEGRTYPVTIYHTLTKHEDYQYATLCTILQLHTTTPISHDFLVFLTGQEEIETVMYQIKQCIKENSTPPIRVCPLYAGLPPNKQLQVWKDTPPGVRKVILATNIAEASITIPKIKCVIDCGMVKERTWCVTTGAERLRVTPCAKTSCWQRAGRAGRVAPGKAYRLFTNEEFSNRPEHVQPEITRCPLAPTILLLLAVGVEPTTFPLMDKPSMEATNSSLRFLKELGAIEKETNAKMTPLGNKMAAFPLDPRYAKLILTANEFNCLDEILSIISILSSENIYHNPLHEREEAFKVRQKFVSPLGDHITMLNVFKTFCKTNLKKQWCKENFLNHRNLTYALSVRQQLIKICQRFNLSLNSCGQAMDQVLKCMLSGLYCNCAWLRGADSGPARYITASGAVASIHPSSTLHQTRPQPPAILYTELLQTRRSYLVNVSALQSNWVQSVERR